MVIEGAGALAWELALLGVGSVLGAGFDEKGFPHYASLCEDPFTSLFDAAKHLFLEVGGTVFEP